MTNKLLKRCSTLLVNREQIHAISNTFAWQKLKDTQFLIYENSLYFPTNYLSDCVFRTFIKASFGTSTLPTFLSFFFPSACLFKSFIFRVISPPY